MYKILMQLSQRRAIGILLAGCMLFAVSCKTENMVPMVNESVKNIDGTWKIASATLNGTDILNTIPDAMTHLTGFGVTFTDGKYTLANPIPFIVDTDGTYTFNDPQYPFDISFTPTGTTTAVKSTFLFPVVQGQRRVTLTFSPGCSKNIYVYTLKKDN
nr:DUF5004 domain-containing protein [Mucilaginibacter sp. L294]